MAKYLDDTEFYFEIVVSKGRGKLTKKSERMLILIGEKMIKKFEHRYKTNDDKNDCLQHGILSMFSNWKNFNEKKYTSAFPYFSEVCKRGIAGGLKELYNRKNNQESPRMISLSSSNEGRGLHNI